MAAQGLQKKKFVISITEGLARIGLLILTYLIVKDALQTIIFWAYESAVIYFFVTLFTYRLMDLKLKRLVILKVTMVLLFISIFLWKHFI